MHPPTSSRTSEPTGRREAPPDDRLRERDPGPITTNAHVARSWSDDLVYDWHRWLWVPAFAGGRHRRQPLAAFLRYARCTAQLQPGGWVARSVEATSLAGTAEVGACVGIASFTRRSCAD